MVRVKLIAYNKPIVGDDPRRLVVLAVKVSSGKLHERDWSHYLSSYSEKDVHEHLVKASRYPVILEHIVFTFLIEDISRVTSHQLVRHRLATYTQESQRYSESYMKQALECLRRYGVGNLEDALRLCTENLKIVISCLEKAFIIPRDILSNDNALQGYVEELLRALFKYYELQKHGVKLEDARFVIPQAVKTRILMTVNLRELLHIACLRLQPEAQWEIRDVVESMIHEAEHIVPEIRSLLKSLCTDKL